MVQAGNDRVLDIGVVIAGAGARGAYEAGLLAHLLPELAGRVQEAGRVARFSFFGTSAGSLTAVLAASRAPQVAPDDHPDQVRALWSEALAAVTRVWEGVHEERVLALRPGGRVLGALARVIPGWHHPLPSLLNVDPLAALAEDPDVVDWGGLHARVAAGTVPAIAASTTARDGRTVLFLHRGGNPDPIPRDERRDIDYVDTDGLGPEHVLASAAIPALFPAVRITRPAAWEGWYYDGGVRLNTPLKPALELGLDHLLIIGTHPSRYERDVLPDPALPAPEVDEAAVPVVTQLMADQLVQDLQTLRSRNGGEGAVAVRHLFAGPPSMGTLAGLSADARPPWGISRVLRALLAGPARAELSSYVLFDRAYLSASVDAGRTRASQILPPGNGPVPWVL